MNAEQFQTFIANKEGLLGVAKPVKEGEGMRGWLDARTKDVRSSVPPAAASWSTASRKNA